jgi:hypothetical protein
MQQKKKQDDKEDDENDDEEDEHEEEEEKEEDEEDEEAKQEMSKESFKTYQKLLFFFIKTPPNNKIIIKIQNTSQPYFPYTHSKFKSNIPLSFVYHFKFIFKFFIKKIIIIVIIDFWNLESWKWEIQEFYLFFGFLVFFFSQFCDFENLLNFPIISKTSRIFLQL